MQRIVERARDDRATWTTCSAIAGDMEGKTICVFADAAAWPVQSYITKFRGEFEAHHPQAADSGAEQKEAAPCPA